MSELSFKFSDQFSLIYSDHDHFEFKEKEEKKVGGKGGRPDRGKS